MWIINLTSFLIVFGLVILNTNLSANAASSDSDSSEVTLTKESDLKSFEKEEKKELSESEKQIKNLREK
ncbi:hypothetical protein [Terrilactibacillus laevilacticus]|uniref:hypothetical protein n=1 Tax=Terrilactibacillus laevilacticus TaxID=1380157 RepID=UPI00114767BD|nr:hypothetical protein [Terrilactibacillus laevilacticus]